MEIKTFEIRDRATFIPAMAVSFDGSDSWLIKRAGFSTQRHIYLTHLQTGESRYDPYSWGMARTMREAHLFILDNWETLVNEQVIDVEFILDETSFPQKSERFL